MFTKVPPNGGWGWIIVVASALNGVSCRKYFIRIYKMCQNKSTSVQISKSLLEDQD